MATKLDSAAVLAALAEQRRADIVRLLEKGYRSQRELSDELDMSQPLISHHLKVLRDAGLVASTVCERVTVYVLRPSTLTAMAERLHRMADHAAEIAKTKPC
jgi:ArsR family transcriptional regulator